MSTDTPQTHSDSPGLAALGRRAVQTIYDRTVRPRLPRKLAYCNGVFARRVRLFDSSDHRPEYQAQLLGAIREHVREGDRVLDVGGGYGVAAVAAARAAGPDGHVVSMDAAAERVADIRETAAINGVADRISAEHAQVGPDRDVWGDATAARRTAVVGLPDCDVLVLDIEGAEAEVVPSLPLDAPDAPRVVIVEVHAHAIDMDTSTFRALLEEAGYAVDRQETSGTVEGYVLTGVREASEGEHE